MGLGRCHFLFVFFIALLGGHEALAAFPTFGTYVGTLRHESLKRDQLAKLELISSREDGNQLELIGILTLHFGDYESGEYANYHFDKVIYQPLNKARPLVFQQSDQEVTIVVSKFTPDAIEGKLRSNFSNDELGTLTLQRGKPVKPSLPLIPKVAGDYDGMCSGKPWRLRIQTFRSTADTSRVGNPFSAYEIRGQLADSATDYHCPFGKGEFCNRYLFSSGTYNFFKNDLRLTGPTRTLKCETTNTTLKCGSCTFSPMGTTSAKTEYEWPKSEPVAEILSPAPSANPALKSKLSEIEGVYKGYLHHEYLDAYQPVSINIVTYQAPTGGATTSLQMSAVASLHFGDFGSGETIAYRFSERSYPDPLLAPHFVFKRPENDVDAILQINSIKDGEIRGNWYSILFGRVGSFTASKDTPPALPKTVKTIKALSAPYESTGWDLDLTVSLDKTPPNTDNPFFPLSLSGHFYHKDGITPRIQVMGGSYNFYTGRIAIQMGKAERVIAGERGLDGMLRLQWTPAVTLTPFQKGNDNFRIRPEEEDYL